MPTPDLLAFTFSPAELHLLAHAADFRVSSDEDPAMPLTLEQLDQLENLRDLFCKVLEEHHSAVPPRSSRRGYGSRRAK